MNFTSIYEEAMTAAKAAEAEFLANYGEPMYCGFAWVDIPSARTPFVLWCKKKGVGSKHWKKGWQIWNPAGNYTQSMDIKEAGAYAFSEVLNKHGVKCHMGSRAD